MLQFNGDLNQLLIEYGVTDVLERGFLTLIAQSSDANQALKFARSALRHTPTLQPVLRAVLHLSHPSVVDAFAQPQPDPKPELPPVQPAEPTAVQPVDPAALRDILNARYNALIAARDAARDAIAAVQAAQIPPATHTAQPSTSLPRGTVKLDSEIGRLAVALNCASELRLWLLGREVADQGRGWLTLDELRAQVRANRIDLGARQVRRLVAQGQGVFWRIDRQGERLYLYSIVKIGAYLAREATRINPDMVASNLPGMLRQVYVPLDGSLAQFEARIYAAWFTVKNAPMIARETLSMLFRRDKRTLRRWEQALLPEDESKVPYARRRHRPALEVIHAEAQSADLAGVRERPGNHDLVPVRVRTVWVPHLEQGEWKWCREQRVSWSLPNRYRSHNMKEHPHTGQARRVLRAAAYAAGFQSPLVETVVRTRGINRNPRRYFEHGKRLRSYVKRYGDVPYTRYLWRGEVKRGKQRRVVQLYEPNENGHPATNANERPVVLNLLERYQQRQNWRQYLDWFNAEKGWDQLAAVRRAGQ